MLERRRGERISRWLGIVERRALTSDDTRNLAAKASGVKRRSAWSRLSISPLPTRRRRLVASSGDDVGTAEPALSRRAPTLPEDLLARRRTRRPRIVRAGYRSLSAQALPAAGSLIADRRPIRRKRPFQRNLRKIATHRVFWRIATVNLSRYRCYFLPAITNFCKLVWDEYKLQFQQFLSSTIQRISSRFFSISIFVIFCGIS